MQSKTNPQPDPADVRQHRLRLCWVRNAADTRPREEELTLDDLAERWSRPDLGRGTLTLNEYHALNKANPADKKTRNREKDGEAFIPAIFSSTGVRDAKSVTALHGFVFDFDGGVTRGEIEQKLAGYAYIAYTSYSHRPEDERLRVFIPYLAPIAPEEHARVVAWAEGIFGERFDARSKTVNQLWYSPACPPDAGDQYLSWFHEAPLLDPRQLPLPDQGRATGSGRSSRQKVDMAQLEAALRCIPSDDRTTWIKVGMALYNELGDDGLPLWLEWSKASPKYDKDDALKNWGSFKPKSNGLTAGTIFYLARQYGWTGLNPSSVAPADIAEINRDHFMARENGKTLVFRETTEPVSSFRRIQRLQPQDVRDYYRNRTVQASAPGGNGRTKIVGLGDHWLSHPDRRTYEEVIFTPNHDAPGCYNLWQGFTVNPAPGDWSLLQAHIREVICSANAELADYVTKWLAFAVQHPDQPAEVALVLRGERGTGKGTVVNAIGRLFGPHFTQINQSKHLVGNFNAHLADCVVLFADEAFWAGDKQGENTLKALITEPRLFIEPKGRDAHAVPNRLHIVIASNSEWVVPAGHHERRFCVLEVSNSHRQDLGYFAALREQLDHGGYEAMLHDLLRLDLSHFNIRKVPHTEALQEQTVQSLKPQELWWLDQLQTGDWWEDTGPQHSASVSKADMAEVFSRECLKHYSHGAKTKLGMMLKRVLPAGWPQTQVIKSKARSTVTTAGEHYLLPPLPEARAHFERVTGLPGLFEGVGGRRPAPNNEDLSTLPTLISMSEERGKRGNASGGLQPANRVAEVG